MVQAVEFYSSISPPQVSLNETRVREDAGVG